jgi:hypothetical protein
VKYSQKELNFIVERIDKQAYELSEWEQSFFASVKPRIEKGLPLSPKQAEVLSGIWDKIDLR